MATQILDVLTIIKCLDVAEEKFLKPGRVWRPKNDSQARFLTLYNTYRADVVEIEDLKAKADRDVGVINRWLSENGFNIQLNPIPVPEGFAVASILDRLVRWLAQADEVGPKIRVGGRVYPGFRLEGRGVSFYISSAFPHPIVILDTQTGDQVFLTFADHEIADLDLVYEAIALLDCQKKQCDDFKGVRIPQVMIDQQPDISWLLGLNTLDPEGQFWFIQQALQQAKFAMNKEGCRIKVATAVAVTRGFTPPKPDLIFDRPFLATMRGREGIPLPVFSIYVDTDTWKEADLYAL